MSSKGTLFKELLHGDEMILRPCAYDSLSAILIERAGFEVVGTTGYGISASLIGQPDIGLVGFHEMFERVRTIINAIDLPVDVDIDTGYGNALNVSWTVRNFADIGAAGVRIEDQVWPKRCGHMAGKQVIPIDDMLRKINSAVRTRDEAGSDMAIGARTDARAVNGFKDALKRAVTYAEAGADYVYVEAPQNLEEVKTLVDEIPVPLMFNVIPGGRTPPFSFNDLEELGVSYVSVPMICLYPAVKAMKEALNELRTGKNVTKLASMGVSWTEFNEIVNLSYWRRKELEFLSDEEAKRIYGSTDLEEIMEQEKQGTEEMWKKES